MAAPSSGANIDRARPGAHAAALTASDATVLLATRGLYVGGAGNVAVTMAGDGASVTFTAVPAGSVLPVSVTQLLSTGTTATAVVALW